MLSKSVLQGISSTLIALFLIFAIFTTGFGWNVLDKYDNLCNNDLAQSKIKAKDPNAYFSCPI